ncbi:hypothetical protein K4R62_11160 [Staphylococcus epidermidis]|uniref:hypothetical protein n=1 Tax=Staphylococcus TaxID=1279 RepID=UPI000AFCB3A2|nr:MULTISPECIES: hypothetical protein [Staphylococcus]HCD8274052.1 hypothetical protein [Staphylococcus aureus]MCG1455411.1 hypothetical protein [Staphylococcus epidermidis]MCG1491865.1 hypothetical protein [Staphylococcus epidermidis]MCG1700723.1 hypothetical protein [Staphylococcus epidermidis]MCG2082990.1 hypothetical protein [Staphylococcus epidermidis]
MTLAKGIILILLQLFCVFLAIQIDLAVGGLSFITIFIIGFALFAIIYLAFLYPYWNKN